MGRKRNDTPLKVKIYINNRPIEDYPPEELEEIKIKLTEKAMAAIGYVRADKYEERNKVSSEARRSCREQGS